MSFRKYGGTQFASSHNIVKSNVNTTDSFYVTKNVGQPNTYINFESDISGNVNIYGDLDISGNLNVSGDVDINGKLHVQEDIDCSGNLNVSGDVDINGKLHVQEDIDCSGNVNIDGDVDINGKLHVQQDIDCSGNVNIDGDVDINGKLHVQENIDCSGNFQVTTSNTNPSVIITKNPGNYSTFANTWQHQAQLQIQNTFTPSPNTMILAMSNDGVGIIQGATLNNGNYNNICLNPVNANVGIRTFTPQFPLDVDGSGNFSGLITALAPSNGDSSSKVPTTAWVQGLISSGGYATLAGNNTWTGSNIFNQQVTALSYNAPSDYRIKKDVVTLDETFTVDKLRPVTYNNTKLDKQDIGLIAHELQEIYPFLVTGEKDGENLQSVNYTGLIAILIKEIQDLKERVKKLEEK